MSGAVHEGPGPRGTATQRPDTAGLASDGRTLDERLAERAGRPGLAPLWEELARRLGASDAPVASVTLRDLDGPARHALADLLGSDRLPGATCRVRTARLASALGIRTGDMRPLVERLIGPLPDRAAERRQRARRRQELWEWLGGEVCGWGLEDWVSRMRAGGIPRGDVEAHRRRLEAVVGVLRRLPADGVALPALAADALGNPHALDHGTWSGRAVVDAIAAMGGRPAPRTAEEERAEWDRAGVAADTLSPSVLTLGFRPEVSTPLGEMIGAMTEHGEPVALTFAQLRRWPLTFSQPVVHVFENPSILAEAARTAWSGPPLVCMSGWPNVAVLTLLRQAGGPRCELRVHCDFDPKGLEIAQMVTQRVGATPWRMRCGDYEEAALRAAVPITAPVPDTPWDPQLADAMRSRGLAVFEEDIREGLLRAAYE